MAFAEGLKKWFAKFERYKVTYRKGFFHLSNLANSPYTIIGTFDKMPFCKHNPEKKLITAGTIFLDAQLYYTELEEGLWVLVSNLEYKKNLEMTNIYDKSLPMDFNFINLHYNSTPFKSKSMLINGRILTDKTWSMFKAGHALSDVHFKDAHESNIGVYFTNEWLNKQINSESYFAGSSIDKFFKSDNTYMVMPDNDIANDRFYQDFLELVKQNAGNVKNNEIRKLLTSFFMQFIGQQNSEEIASYQFKLTDTDRKYIQRTEKYLKDNLLTSFPGIENIAKKIGVSPTKLKSDFKTIHNQSIYQYYRYHQMWLANTLLSEKAITVKEVANLIGYENASKFAAVFKEQFGVQPSALIKQASFSTEKV
jgi:AraC-like DNA-binding protein